MKSPELVAQLASDAAARRPNRAGWVHVHCPFCGSRRRSMSVNPGFGWFKCLKCPASGPLPGAVRRSLHPGHSKPSPAVGSVLWPEGVLSVAEALASPFSAPAFSYLQRRGISLERARGLGLGFGLGSPIVDGRIVIPFRDGSRLWGWTARDWTGRSEAKYLTSEAIDDSRCYNDEALECGGTVVLVEGPIDAISLWPYGVALLGKPTPKRVDRIVERAIATGARLIAALDGDAWRQSQALAWTLRMRGAWADHLRLPPKCDPDSIGRAWVLRQCGIRDNAA